MFTTVLTTVALAGIATAFTPPGFQPSSSSNLAVAFGNVAAVNGVDLPKASTQAAPTVGTAEKLFGTYALIMVDPDIPPANPGGPTGQLLHWMQAGLVSASARSTIAGQQCFELVNPTNISAIATYAGPQPPARSPTTHRYTQLLVNTTGNQAALAALTAAGATRRPFSAQDVISAAGLTVLAGNYFNVTNSSTSQGSRATATGSGALPSSTIPFRSNARLIGPGAVVAGLGSLMVLLL